jgi:hypothetical protein
LGRLNICLAENENNVLVAEKHSTKQRANLFRSLLQLIPRFLLAHIAVMVGTL